MATITPEIGTGLKFEGVQARALKRALAEQLMDSMQSGPLIKEQAMTVKTIAKVKPVFPFEVYSHIVNPIDTADECGAGTRAAQPVN